MVRLKSKHPHAQYTNDGDIGQWAPPVFGVHEIGDAFRCGSVGTATI